jgi:predicted oxidoreductase
LESLVEKKLVKSLGVVDLNVAQLTELLSFAKVAPTVNQIALSEVTSDLLTFSKSSNIELCARPSSDSDVDLSAIDSSSVSSDATSTWSLSWTLRYSVTAKHQHLLLTKGYLYGFAAVKATKSVAEPVVPAAAILSH